MRILHTSDWHLGRSFHRVDLLGAQAAYVDHLVDVVRSERVRAVVVAGDIYDRALPGVDAVSLCDEALARLADAGANVIAISGNHHSARRLGFGARLMARAGVHVRSDVHRAADPVLLTLDDGTPLAVYAVPYLEPDAVRPLLGADVGRGHEAVLTAMLARCRADLAGRPGTRSVVIAHAFVRGGEPSESERDISVGGISDVPLSVLAGFDYVALGHLHGRQRLAESVRYSGSPIAYSFSERDHVKGSWIADLSAAGLGHVAFVDAPVGRRLATVTGSLDEILASPAYDAYADHFLSVTLTDPGRVDDAMTRVQRRFPHAVHLEWQPVLSAGAVDASYRERIAGRDTVQIAAEFVEHARGTRPSAAESALLADVVERERRSADETPRLDVVADGRADALADIA
ncbi:MAG: repair protein SbcD/Mre11 [Frankiaceae bacterium]|nr:repair protein SbcD/Mre11 [Frankiaceae bacterium]